MSVLTFSYMHANVSAVVRQTCSYLASSFSCPILWISALLGLRTNSLSPSSFSYEYVLSFVTMEASLGYSWNNQLTDRKIGLDKISKWKTYMDHDDDEAVKSRVLKREFFEGCWFKGVCVFSHQPLLEQCSANTDRLKTSSNLFYSFFTFL